MAKHFAIASLTLLAGLVSFNGRAQNVNGTQNFVTTAVPFLRITPDARAGAMGDAGIATTPDANAQYWNVAKLAFSEKNYGISATYTPWLKDLVPDIFLAYISGYAKIGKDNNQTISASMRYFSLGNINYTTNTGDPNGTGQPREYSFDVGYSRKLSENFSTGVSLRYIHSAIASGVSYLAGNNYKPGNALSADAGVFYTKRKEKDDIHVNTLNLGAVVSNLGSKISYNSSRKDFIPMNLGLGVAYTTQFDQYNKMTFAFDVNKLLVPALNSSDTQVGIISGVFSSFGGGNQLQKLDLSLGLEYWYQDQFAVRAGYFYEDKSNGDRQYITAGLGVKYNVFQINAAYIVPQGSGTTRNPLSNTVRFSLLFEFDKINKAAADDAPADVAPPAAN
ncbi:hypothetical protein CJD36_006825 [Flavipsychrobacter stenotrophus]|uniref:Type IX secretion system protein PorV domain-containing protein n=1 Tax=Flavipsychrobacter stenotrophus TaxID=2077091 RepID=A0A2S7SX54_9BACT|nr:type IX secretion system outer membrane channel protein PorV [Flavipsychrobacter stenotrophus]PQJ11510.1 hypothetical protein CJD36_006825 [Flavipsychrobacter stenotrophus]